MRTGFFLIVILLVLGGCGTQAPIVEDLDGEVISMKLTSPAFEEGGEIPSLYTCDGEDINPELNWAEVPKGTKSFALIVDDPDASAGTWVHWILVDIPASVRSIQQDRIVGKEIRNSFGRESFGGPCPPSGVHRYYFKLYALDVETLKGVNPKNVNSMIEEHKIGEAVLMGKYKRS